MSHPKATDRPDKDPNVKKLGRDVTAMSVAEMKRVGIQLAPRPVHVTSKNPAWVSHSSYVGMMPTNRPDTTGRTSGIGRKTGGIEHDVIERGYARQAALAHYQRNKTLAGLKLQRTFPCLGTFRHLEWVEGGKFGDTVSEIHVVQCDVCGLELTVRAYAESTPDETKPKPDDDDYGGF